MASDRRRPSTGATPRLTHGIVAGCHRSGNTAAESLYERAPLQFWQGVAALLALALLLSLLLH
jgi:hypothetical protein